MSLKLESLGGYPCVEGQYGINFAKFADGSDIIGPTEGGNLIYAQVNKRLVQAIDSTDKKICMSATCSPLGTVEFDLMTQRLNYRHPDFFAGQFLIATISHFAENGTEVTKLAADWYVGSTNFTLYAQARHRGLAPEAAAWETWTGRQASKLGFTSVKGRKIDENFEVTFVFGR
jgi:hypothetical protein